MFQEGSKQFFIEVKSSKRIPYNAWNYTQSNEGGITFSVIRNVTKKNAKQPFVELFVMQHAIKEGPCPARVTGTKYKSHM